jgi:protein TonB
MASKSKQPATSRIHQRHAQAAEAPGKVGVRRQPWQVTGSELPTAANDLRAISTPQPTYPPEALRSGTSGEVIVELTVDVDGAIASARVVRGNPPRVFDRAAVAAVKRWRFQPIASSVTTRRTIGFNPGR